ncbi:glycerol-3-phosphate dehydrogenase [Rhodobacteraceae bacterium WD3A24]|nr:glycerol-3-phosphate dehydrogenase [Rhodobacteraceae bacterium WD3A24]
MTSDFLIIGGGIAGLSAAARLSHLGSVTLLEAEEHLGFHASGRSAALFEPGYGAAPTVALNQLSEEYHASANGGVLSPRGLMVVARADQAAQFERDAAAQGLAPITPEAACERLPILDPARLAFAAFTDAARDIDSDRLLQNFAREARGNGATILTRAGVEGIARAAGGWQVQTAQGVQSGRILVNAAGAWADRIAGMAGLAPIGLQPLRRSMARLPAPGGHDVSAWPMIVGAGETWYAKPDAGKWLVSPADEDPVEPHDAWADDMVLAEGLARYEEMVTEPVTRVEISWAGLRSFAPDRTLVIGPDPAEPAFAWFAGQGGQGFQSAPAASRLLADLLGGTPPEPDADLVAALTPGRLRR